MIQATPFHPAFLTLAEYSPSEPLRDECQPPTDREEHYLDVSERFLALKTLL